MTTRTPRAVAADLLRGATRSLVKRWPIERCPGWLGTLHRMRVPAHGERRRPEGGAGAADTRSVFRLLAGALTFRGDVAQYGVGHGHMLLSLGLFVRQRQPEKRVIGLDPLPDPGVPFDELLARRMREYGLLATVYVDRGPVPPLLRRHAHRRFCFVVLGRVGDGSDQNGLEFFYPRVRAGGVIVLEAYGDGSWPAGTLAVDAFLADKPEKIERLVGDAGVTYFIRRAGAEVRRPSTSPARVWATAS
jgi:hypothetical protein